MVICEKCKAMTKYNKFIWCCPICGIKFRDDGSQNENYHINNNINNNKENSEILSPFDKNNFYDVTIPNKKDEVNHLELYKQKRNKNKKQYISKFDENKIVDVPIFDKSKYDIISELNEGKKSKVYCVKDDDNKFYAMKVKEIQNEDEKDEKVSE